MNRHASMNRIYRLVWSQVRGTWVPVAETARGGCKSGGSKSISSRNALAAAISLALAPLAHGSPAAPPCVASTCGNTFVAATTHPLGGQIVSGSASIIQSGNVTDIRQLSADVSIDWLSFNIGSQATVDFLQPSASSVAVNRILGNNGSQILGRLDANGQVWLVNPNGIVFGPGAQVNVGGLVASTLNANGSALSATTQSFAGNGSGSIVNQGTITSANGGYVALIGNRISNQGVITAQLGTVALAAGSAVTLDFSGNRLVHLQVDQSTLNNLAQNNQLIEADGGLVIMTAGAQQTLLASVVNNSGVIEARTVANHNGTIELLGGMTAGTVNVGGMIDASARGGGNGGFIETSGAKVEVANDAKVTTAAARGLMGTWLIDPQDFTVAPTGGDITGATLSTELGTTSVTLQSSSGLAAGSGNINVNDNVSWSANSSLTLTASNNVNVNGTIAASGANAALVIQPNTANGSETPSGTGTLNVGAGASITLSGASAGLSIGTSSYTLGPGATINLPDVLPTSTTALIVGGTPYTVINSLGSGGSVTGTDLQGINGKLSGYYALGSNINASSTASWRSGAGFTPIGQGSFGFTGTFDGLGHAISDLTIDEPLGLPVGLFGVVGSSSQASVIRNVGLMNGSVSGLQYVGLLAGYIYNGTVSNSYATGSVRGSDYVGGLVGFNAGTISDSYATGSVTGSSGSYYVGGLVGFNAGTISDSYATGSVSGSDGAVGGLVGWNYKGSISDSYATGSVSSTDGAVGGLVGSNYGTISNSYAKGSVSGTGTYVGGLVGYNNGTVSDGFWDTTTSGQTTSAGGTGLTTAQMQTTSNFTGFTFTTTPGAGGNSWVMVDVDGTLNNAGGAAGATFPMLASEYSTTINNAHQLQLMAMNLTAAYTLGQNINASATGNGTDVWGSSGFVPIGSSSTPFTGTFNGLGNAISNLTINLPSASDVGLFGYTGAGSAIQNLGLIGGGVSGSYYVGGLVGFSNGGTVSNSYVTGSVSGGYNVGGLVGYSIGAITNSYATGSVSGITGSEFVGGLVGQSAGTITNSYATASVSGTEFAGGLAGMNAGTVSNSYATGQVSGSSYVGGMVGRNLSGTVSNGYATGNVSGSSYVGGLVGFDSGGTISNSFWNTTTSAQTTSAGGIGLMSAQMQTASSFTGWSIATTGGSGDVWRIYQGHTFPLLVSFLTPLTLTDAPDTTVTYNGSAQSGPSTAISVVLGAAATGTNAGFYNGYYSTQQGYDISGGNLTINPLASVAWTGGKSGNWSGASNWAGGVLPDLGNVLAVTIPKGDTVTYDPGMALLGTTVLTSLTSAGTVVMAAGSLDTTGTFSTAGFSQTGGTLTAGTLKIASTSASGVQLGDITAGTLSVTSKGGAITELAGASVDVTGATTLTAENGASYYGITLDSAGNGFTGAITSTGLNTDLESGTGNLTLGATTATGSLTVTALDGSIAQAKGKTIDVAGLVTAQGSAITLDSGTALDAAVTSTGAVSLTSVGAMDVSGNVGTTLKTTTTGTDATTTFGATTVGKSLTVVSTGAVTETSSNILTVDGKGTTTVSNAHVTVNGVKGAKIPAP